MNKRFALILIALALLLTTAAWSWDLRLSPAMRPIAPAPTKVVPQIDVVYTDTAPTIDGDIDLTGEWADAEVVHVTGTRDMDVYFLADENYLYLGYDLLDNSDLVNGDASVFLFDNNNDDAWPDDCPGTTEGIYAAGYFDGSMNEYYTTVYNDGGTPADFKQVEHEPDEEQLALGGYLTASALRIRESPFFLTEVTLVHAAGKRRVGEDIIVGTAFIIIEPFAQ